MPSMPVPPHLQTLSGGLAEKQPVLPRLHCWIPACAGGAPAAGMITSMDDFYILDSHLVVTETSNGVLDPEVWKQVVPQSALSWQRVLAANWLSSSGKDWAHWIKQYNSGVWGPV